MLILSQALSLVGTVQAVLENGDLRVQYPGCKVYTINGNAVSKVCTYVRTVHTCVCNEC